MHHEGSAEHVGQKQVILSRALGFEQQNRESRGLRKRGPREGIVKPETLNIWGTCRKRIN